MNGEDNIHEQLTKAGVELDHHSSDLYAKKTPVSERILRNYEHRENVKTFRNQKDGSIWFDIPFAYTPFWDKVRSRASAASELVKIAKSLTAVSVVEADRLQKKLIRDYESEYRRRPSENMGDKYMEKFEDFIGDVWGYGYGDRQEIQTLRKELFDIVMLPPKGSSKTKRSNAMSRDRLTGHDREAAEVLAEIQSLERKMEAADDADLTSEADDIAKKEKEVVSQRDVGVELKDNGDQNAKANANWPIIEEERMNVASKLVKFAKMLLND